MKSSKTTGSEYSDPAPLARMEIERLLNMAGYPTTNEKFMEVCYRITRLIEHAHGITMDEPRKTK